MLLHFKFEIPDSQLFLLYLEASAYVCKILYRHYLEGNDKFPKII